MIYTYIQLDDCENDADCVKGHYCKHAHKFSICHKCEDCQYYYREGSGRSCPKSGLECGPCQKGYSELSQANKEVSPRCVKNDNIVCTDGVISSSTTGN